MGRKTAGVGAAILGFYAAIKICRREEHNPRTVFEMMMRAFEEGEIK